MKKENPKVLNDFLNYLIVFKNYSKGTVEGYNTDLIIFFNFLIKYLNLKIKIKDMSVFILSTIKESDIIAFLVYLNYNRDNSFKTRQRKLSSIKSFYKWLFSHFPIFNSKENPTKNIPHIEITERTPKHLRLNDALKIQHIFNISNSRNPARDNTIITLFLNCGLRLSELTGINLKDIDFNNTTLNVIGKGNKERTVYLNKSCLTAIKNYIEVRPKEGIKNDANASNEPLFKDNRNKRITIFNIEKICKKAFMLAGLKEYKYTTHSLRHTSATYLYESTKNILIVKEFLGHSSITSTQIYSHINNENIKNAINNNPLNSFKLKEKAA